MSKNWAAFMSVSVVALLLATIGVVGATQGLFGFGGDAETPQVINLRRTASGGLEIVDSSLVDQISAESAGSDGDSAVDTDRSTETASVSTAPSSTSEATNGTATASTSGAVGATPAAQTSASSSDILTSRSDDDGGEELAPTTAAIEATLGETTYQVGDAGLVTLALDDSGLRIVAVAPAADWRVKESEAGDAEAKVEFQRGEVEVEFKAVIKGGEIHASVSVEQEHEESHDEDHEEEPDEDDEEEHD